MDPYTLLRAKQEFPFQVKTEIKTEIQVTAYDDSLQNHQHCIIKEEVMLSSDLEYSADEFESENHDHEKGRNNVDQVVENPCNNQKMQRAGLIKIPTLQKDDIDLDLAIAKLGQAFCTKCRKRFKAVSRQIRCKLCSKAYLYKCSACLNSSYKTFSDLCQHLKIKHTALRELYTCSACRKSFNQRKHVNQHLKVCGLKPKLKCDNCPYKARYKCNLVNHMKSKHSEPVSSNCDRCGKRYTNERSMRRHARLYCGKSKSFKCEHCKFTAYRKDQLIGHLKLKHPKVYPRSVRRSRHR